MSIEIDLIALIGLVTVLLLSCMLWRLHHNHDINFNMTDALMENGRVSRQALFEVGAFIATTWVLVHQEFKNVVTDWYVLLYGGFWISKSLLRVWKAPNVGDKHGQ